MDGSALDHSDSDSGDSWTIVENNPTYGDVAPEFTESDQEFRRSMVDSTIEKDEDTDGISIISDSEPESSTPCEIISDHCDTEVGRSAENDAPQPCQPTKYISFNPIPPHNISHEGSVRADFLGSHNGKHKTYVHRRNKRLSTMLNIIMLGSVITAAGVAIGHMWGVRNECAVHTTPSINKILSNLYKLQEENTYLRNKLKELTFVNSLQVHQKKLSTADRSSLKQRCKKVYEGPLNSKNTEPKCIDHEINNYVKNSDHLVQPEYEKEFLKDVDKLKNIYQQNRSWLDDAISKRLKHEEDTIKKMAKHPLSSITEEQKTLQEESPKLRTDSNNSVSDLKVMPDTELTKLDIHVNDKKNLEHPIKKITYADSLKSDQQQHKLQKRNTNIIQEKDAVDNFTKNKVKKDKVMVLGDIMYSEEELSKDDRYTGQKHKKDKKKRDRQKLYKKQKRRNKYEQWEMKGGYMKDYEDFSITSLPENNKIFRKPDDNKLSRDFEKTHYINQCSETDSTQNINIYNKPKEMQKQEKSTGKNNKGEDLNWYDQRAAYRTEARKRLEHELFGETSPNNAVWYFRRMQKREQCRAKSDNSTHRKLVKRNINFKMKH